MRKVGDIVLFENKKAVVKEIIQPKCLCKGQSFYVLHLVEENYRKKIPLSTVLESWKDDFKIKQNIMKHEF